MLKIKDRFMLGCVTGLLVATPLQVINALIHKHRITDVSYNLSASKLFLTGEKIETPGGKAISSLVTYISSSLAATFIAYTLSLTGKDKAIIKGAGIGAMQWIVFTGFLANIGLNIKSKRPSTPLIALAEHLVHGALSSYIITKIGDDSLFPANNNASKREKIPVVSTQKTVE